MKTAFLPFAILSLLGISHSQGLEPQTNSIIQDLHFYAGISYAGKQGTAYELQYSTNLQNPGGWTTLTNVIADPNRLFFLDLESPASPARFYRLHELQPAPSGANPAANTESAVILDGGIQITRPPTQAQPSVATADGSVIPGWGGLLDPDHDCRLSFNARSIKIEVPNKPHDFAAELQRWNAPRLMAKVRGDFIIEVKIGGEFNPEAKSTIPGRRPYNGAGLLLVQDNTHHLSLQRGAVRLGSEIRHYANFELRHDPDASVSNFEFDLEDRDTLLRLAREGDKFLAMASQDGTNWRPFKTITVSFPEELSVGIEAINSASQHFACTFEGLTLYRGRTPGIATRKGS